ncbi:SoxR reducing system RseC family protein [Sporosalibacterium faouarense]|uniref:SoxR reducing system RseC family protein n=1 Tax=Sporosalibacterium faouarense TaxID=516123 RepID=UPI00141CAECC|nr:SoxR reducing system RseC family protein [Sporosalibacterium faouarense]MTI47776.1 SoxR reducing system RseC family protein [Bacillota bacterium]
MNQLGYVTKVDNGIAHLEVRRVSACGDKCGSCGGGCNVPATKVKIKNSLGAEKGDMVEVEMQTDFVLKSAFLVYIMPLILMVGGIIGGINLFENLGIDNYEALGFASGILLLGVSYFILRIIDKSVNKSDRIHFKMVKILKN